LARSRHFCRTGPPEDQCCANLPHGLNTLSHGLADPPVTVMGRRALLPPIALAALSRRLPTRGRHFSPNLCNRLIVTGTHQLLRFSSSQFALFSPASRAPPSTRTLVRASKRHRRDRCWIATRTSPTSSDAAVGAAVISCIHRQPCP
jgi:hypothetical protein